MWFLFFCLGLVLGVLAMLVLLLRTRREADQIDEVRQVLEMTWADRRQSWKLQADGRWVRVDPGSSEDGIQENLIERARARPLRWEGQGRRVGARGRRSR